MKKNSIIIFLLFGFLTFQITAQNFGWAKNMGRTGTGGIEGSCVSIDSQNNIYTSGKFNNTVDFDPSPNTFTLNSASDGAYIQKLDASGNFQWAKAITASNYVNYGTKIVVDLNDNVYLLGSYNGVLDCDPGVGTYTISSATSGAGFLIKLNSSGNFLWAKSVVAAQNTSVTLDQNNSLFISDTYIGTIDFDPGSSVFNLTATNGGLFILKLDQAGNFLWAKSIENSQGFGYPKIDTDNNGNIYVAGDFRGTVDFDPSAGTSALTSVLSGTTSTADIFMLKLNSIGDFLWVKTIGAGINENVTALTVDKNNSALIICGYYGAVTDFNPSLLINNLAYGGGSNTYTAKYDLNGGYLWAKGYKNQAFYNYLDTDFSGNVITLGWFQYAFDADPGTGTYSLTPVGSSDTYMQKLDGSGNFLWAGSAGGIGTDQVNSMSLDNNGNICYTGYFESIADFNPSSNTYTLSPIGNRDAFVSKILPCSHNAPDICLVTVDSLALNNVIYWDKSLFTSADTFIVYRYDALTTNYLRVGAKAANQPNFLIDTARTIGGPNGGNPQYSSYRYKLAIRDVCGTTGTKGLYHESIFIQQNNQNFSWNAYGIEGQTSPATGYQFMRDNTNIGNWQVLVNTGGLSTTDPNYATYPNGNWRVDALGFSCNPTAKLSPNAIVNKSKSNVKNNFVVTSANELELNTNIMLSPNPAKTELQINFSNHQQIKTEFIITDVLGKIILKTETQELNKIVILLNDMSSGVYFLNIKQGKLQTTKKFVKE